MGGIAFDVEPGNERDAREHLRYPPSAVAVVDDRR